jgi:hypothetical protein
VRLNPQDLAQVLASAAKQAAAAQGGTVQGATGGLPASAASTPETAAPVLGGLKTVADATLRRGECLLESAEGTVPALLADRLQAVAGLMKHGAK